jgi:hypothetical protein
LPLRLKNTKAERLSGMRVMTAEKRKTVPGKVSDVI